MGFIAHRVNTARINPAVIKIEQRANRQRIINCFVRVARLMQSLDIGGANIHGIEINLTHEPEQRFLFVGKRGRLRIGKHPIHELDGSHDSSQNGRMTS